MKTGRIIPAKFSRTRQKSLFRSTSYTLFFYTYYSDSDPSAIDFLEMSVQFGVNGMTCIIGSVSGLTSCEFPGNARRVDHSCSDKNFLFPRFWLMFPPRGLLKKLIWFIYQTGKCTITSVPLCAYLLVMCPGWDFTPKCSTLVQAGLLQAAPPMAMSFRYRNVRYSL